MLINYSMHDSLFLSITIQITSSNPLCPGFLLGQ